MKLLVLGASGGCGRWIVKLAQERGHQVRGIVRPETQFLKPQDVEIIRGHVSDRDLLKKSLEGSDAVICALGIKRENALNPWSKLASPENFVSKVVEILVPIMEDLNVNRFIGISAAGVGESFHSIHPIIQWMITHSNMKFSYRDLERMESRLEASHLDWMAVRPVTLKNGSPTGRVAETEYYSLTSKVRRADIANWILRKVEQKSAFVKQTPMICSKD